MDRNKEVMSVKDWLITSLVMMIPCVGIIMIFVWAFGDGNENRKNYCRASLIIALILIALYIIILIAFGAAFQSLFDSMNFF